jgi:hypothetical protein
MRIRLMSAAITLAACAGSSLAQANFGLVGYSENFNSMGTSGTAAPTGWRHFATSFGSNSTWGTSIPASGASSVATDAVTTAATVLTATTTPTTNANNGFNAAASAGNTADRVLATAPTTVAGAIIQLELRNNTGGIMTAGDTLTISFDTVRYNVASSANQLPGYWLFASVNGTTWTNVSTVASPNPTITTVPNTVGVTARSVGYVLPSNWNAGTSIYFRWVDDNATQTSPDQIIGLNNVSIVPAPGVIALAGMGGLLVARRRR